MKKKNRPPLVQITNPPKSWNPGDPRVEEFMPSVAKAIKKYHEWPSKEFTDIYNRAYEAVCAAIRKYTSTEREKHWQKKAGRMATIANVMHHYVDESKVPEDDLAQIHNMQAEYLELMDFDEG